MPIVQLAAHAESSTLYGRTSKFFLASWVTKILYNNGATLCTLRAASSAMMKYFAIFPGLGVLIKKPL